MKVNEFCRVPTDNYPYHFLTSVFFKRENPLQVHKLTSSSQEWCGTTFKAINAIGKKYTYSFNSYWDNQGEGKMVFPADVLLEDQLPYTLRSLQYKDGLTFKTPIAESMQTSKASQPITYEATVTVTADKGGREAAWKVTVTLSPDKQNTYWFQTAYPNMLTRQQTWDGRNLQLKEVKRYAYWQH